MSFLKVFFACCFCVLFLSACTNSTEPVDTGVLQPHQVGNYWIYKNSQFNERGEVVKSYIDTVKVESVITYNNEQYYKFVNTTEFNQSSAVMYYINRADGLWQICECSHTNPDFSDLSILAKYPAATGEKFFKSEEIVKTPENKDVIITFFGNVLSTNKSVTVPVGTFSTYQYTTDIEVPASSNLESSITPVFDYFAPGIGLIKNEVFNMGSNKIARVKELIKYKVQ